MTMTDAERQRLWRKRNPDVHRERDQAWRVANPERARQLYREKDRRWREANPEKYLLNHCRYRAKKLGREFSLDLEYVRALTAPMVCSVTGLALRWDWSAGRRRNPLAPSIDRMDNAQGYVHGNVRLVCWAFNCARGNDRMTDDEARERTMASLA